MSEEDAKEEEDINLEEHEAAEDGGDDSSGKSDSGMQLENMEGQGFSEEDLQEFAYGEPMAKDVTAIYDIPVQISAVLGRANMQVSQLLKLGRGAVVELDRKVGEAIDIYVNNRLVARGEVVVVEGKLGVTMTEIVKSDRSN
jgi:flagellar motor switch protein FliN/FliY